MTYNGFTNYDTWNVALWFNNNYGMYVAMCNYVHRCDAQNKQPTYLESVEWHELLKAHEELSACANAVSREVQG